MLSSASWTGKPDEKTNIRILLTHMHLDHLIGLPFFSALNQQGRLIDIYAKARAGLSGKNAIDRLMIVPFWPIKIEEYPANVNFYDLPSINKDINNSVDYTFYLGSVTIAMMEGMHPGGSTVYRLTYKNKSIVYATDFEHISTACCDNLIAFAQNCDLLLYDAQYTEEEYDKFRGYGHSTAETGLKIGQKAGAKRILFVHHAPWRKDEEIMKMENKLSMKHENVMFAKIGYEIVL